MLELRDVEDGTAQSQWTCLSVLLVLSLHQSSEKRERLIQPTPINPVLFLVVVIFGCARSNGIGDSPSVGCGIGGLVINE